MKVLIVLGGDAPGVELLKACADEADFSIAADRGLEAFDAAGLEPDMLVGDMDSVSQNVLARYESRLSEDRLNCIKNDTDCEYALNLAISRGATEIVLLGALGGRLDHALANLMMVVRAARPRRLGGDPRGRRADCPHKRKLYADGREGQHGFAAAAGRGARHKRQGMLLHNRRFYIGERYVARREQRGHGGRSRVHGARRRPDALPLQRYSRTWGKCMNPILLDERLSAAAELAREALTGMERPVAADIGCDHGFLTAKLLETVPNLTMLASDVSAPSLEKARRLLAARGLSGRATLAVADGLSAIDRLVDAVMILGMGAGTILKIVSEGRDKIGGAALIVQANVDLPLLRGGLAELGLCSSKGNLLPRGRTALCHDAGARGHGGNAG